MLLPISLWQLLRSPAVPLAAIDFDFKNGWYRQDGIGQGADPAAFITTSRASTGTDLLPISASGYAYSTFSNNIPRITSGLGLLVEESRTNRLLNSTAPATQTTASLATGTYTLWVNGSGSATSSAGTATGTGFGAATQGSPNNFTLTGAGTVVVTVSGSLNAFQAELGIFGTSLIVTAGAVATRAADAMTVTATPTPQMAYAIFAEAVPYAPTTFGTNQFAFYYSSGAVTNRLALYRVANNGLGAGLITAGGTTILNIAGDTWNAAGVGKDVVCYSSANQVTAFNGGNGGVIGTTASALAPAGITTAYIGSQNNVNSFWNGHIRRVMLWPNVGLQNNAAQRIVQ